MRLRQLLLVLLVREELGQGREGERVYAVCSMPASSFGTSGPPSVLFWLEGKKKELERSAWAVCTY